MEESPLNWKMDVKRLEIEGVNAIIATAPAIILDNMFL